MCCRRETYADNECCQDDKPYKKELGKVYHAECVAVCDSALDPVAEPCKKRIYERQREDDREKRYKGYDGVPVGKLYSAKAVKCKIDIESDNGTVDYIDKMDDDRILEIVPKSSHEILGDLIALFGVFTVNCIIKSCNGIADSDHRKTKQQEKGGDDNHISYYFT